jgi:hypothetical protein
VARPGDELPPRVEELFELRRHRVERSRQLRELGRAVLHGPRAEVTRRNRFRCVPQPVDALGDRPRNDQAPRERDRRGGRGDGQDLDVVAHVEHRPAGEEHRRKRQSHGEQRKPRQLRADARQQA